MKNVTLEDIQYIAFVLARKKMSYNEPIPDYNTRFPGTLESCVATPFMRFEGRYLYNGFVPKAAALFYLMIKNHPFANGNKRIAVTTLLYFLFKNNKWINADIHDLYNFTVWVAGSPSLLKDSVIDGIVHYITTHLVELNSLKK
jgi:death-on-curing family protein